MEPVGANICPTMTPKWSPGAPKGGQNDSRMEPWGPQKTHAKNDTPKNSQKVILAKIRSLMLEPFLIKNQC